MSKYIIIKNNADREWSIIIQLLLKDIFDIIIINESDAYDMREPNLIIRFNQYPDDSIILNDALYIHIIYDEELFCLSYPLAMNYVIVYFNNNNYVDNRYAYNIDFNTDDANHKLLIHILKVMFLWFNYKPLYKSGIIHNSTALLETNQSDYKQYDTHYIFTKSLIDTKEFKKESERGYFLHKYIETCGIHGVNYIKYSYDNFNNFTWLKNFEYPIFGFNRHYSNRNCILFQLENYIDNTTLLNYKIYNIPFQSKIKKIVGYYSQFGSYTRDDNWYHFQRIDQLFESQPNVSYDIAFLCLSNFDRFKACYNYNNNELFELGLVNNNDSSIINKYFPWLIKEKKSIEYLCQYMFHLYLGGNDWGTSLFWQLLNFNVVFMPYPFEYESVLMYGLVPYEHFVPISNKLFDLEDKLKYMIDRPDLCEKIAHKAHNYIIQFTNNDCEFLDLISRETIRVFNETNSPN